VPGQNPALRTHCPPDIPQTEGRKWASTTSEWANPLHSNIHRILSNHEFSTYQHSPEMTVHTSPPPISDRSVWDLWWTKCHWDKLFSKQFDFSPLSIIPQFFRERPSCCVLSNLYNILCTVNTQHTSRQDAIITIRSYSATRFGRKRPYSGQLRTILRYSKHSNSTVFTVP